MAAARRRLRASFRELGEESYRRLREGRLEGDHRLLVLKERIDGLRGEVQTREEELREAMQGPRPPEPASGTASRRRRRQRRARLVIRFLLGLIAGLMVGILLFGPSLEPLPGD